LLIFWEKQVWVIEFQQYRLTESLPGFDSLFKVMAGKP